MSATALVKCRDYLLTLKIGMFEEKENPGYEKLAQDAKGIVAGWLKNEWYETSSDPKPMIEGA